LAERASYRLPRSATPERYQLTLTPDLPSASFQGTAQIRVRVHEPVEALVLNAIELDIHHAALVGPDGRSTPAELRFDEAEEQVSVATGQGLDPGVWELDLSFTGILNDKLRGFYRSTFKDEDGEERVIATTQFEATDARRAFPCWDEPDFKATFAVTLVVDERLTALSNGAVAREEPTGDGKRRVVFAETIPMSSYLVAFVVGPFELTEPEDVDGVPLRVASTPGHRHLTGFALEAGAAALRFLAGYFELPYPGDKLDHVAIPDFAFGAMENLGCVTYRATALLADPGDSSRLELQRVATVVAHETAHMWFGDLVTMKWWNGIWLNEAFATFMELMTTDHFRPEWQVWISFGPSRNAALAVDGLTETRPIEYPVHRPAEADGMFDVLTYQKGGAVLRMLEQYLGAETFRGGIVRYLSEHRFSNTETTDLWDAIEGVSGEPVRATMDSWIFQGGYPLISVIAEDGGRRLALSQQRFLYSGERGDGRWQVPVSIRVSVAGQIHRHRLLLSEDSASVDLPGPLDWVVVNDGAWGFYRVRYETALLDKLTQPLHRHLDPLERLSLISDTWASVIAGHTPLPDYLALLKLLGDEEDPDVWATALGPLNLLDRIVADHDRPLLQRFVRLVVGAAFARVGWDPVPGEADRIRTLRARLILALGTLGADPDVRAEAASRHAAYLHDRSALAPDLVAAAAMVVTQAGGQAEYETMVRQFQTAASPQEEIRYLYALGATEDPALIARTLEMCLSGEVRTQDAPYLVGDILGDRVGARLALAFIEDHWDALIDRFPDNSIDRMLDGIAALADPDLAPRIHRFLDAHPVPQAAKQIAQARERLDINVAFRRRIESDLASLMAAAAS